MAQSAQSLKSNMKNHVISNDEIGMQISQGKENLKTGVLTCRAVWKKNKLSLVCYFPLLSS